MNQKGAIAASRFFPTRLTCYSFIDYAAHHWGDHVHGETIERTLECEILAFLNTPKALASPMQAQYCDANLSYRRSFKSSKYTPTHVIVSFALEHILEAWLENVLKRNLRSKIEDGRLLFIGL